MAHDRAAAHPRLSAAAETITAPLSFLLYRATRLGVHTLVRLRARGNPQQATRWQTLDAHAVARPLNLLALMTSAPRWNTHALIALAGPLHIQHTLRVHAATAAASARSWTVVVHSEPSHHIVASTGSLDSRTGAPWQHLELPPGTYRLALRYYHWSETVNLPAIEIDGAPAVPGTPIPADTNDFYRQLASRRSRWYTCLHSYLRPLLRHRNRLPDAFVDREYLPAGNPQTAFHYGLLCAGTRLDIDLAPQLLQTHDVYFTAYNRASFPVLWYPITQSHHTTPLIRVNGTYLLRLHAAEPATRTDPATAIRVRTTPAGSATPAGVAAARSPAAPPAAGHTHHAGEEAAP